MLPRVEALQNYVWRRHLASAAEHLLDDASTLTATESQLSVCFVDIVGYTTQSRSLDGAALVQWVDGFEQGTTALVVDHGGQVIKTIGDEVLFTVADPAAAVAVALELASRGADEDDPFPAVRAGIAHGPVVRRLGDVFGSTVNAASRLTSAARPGSVLVDAGVHEALTAVTDGGGGTMASRPGASAAPAGYRPRGSATSRPGASGHADGRPGGEDVKARSLLTGETTTTGQ